MERARATQVLDAESNLARRVGGAVEEVGELASRPCRG